MNLHALRLFYTVALEGGVTRASESLGISQPAVTSQLKRFEAELGTPLFVPQRKGVRLTDAGQALLVHARRLFAVERDLEGVIRAFSSGSGGTITIAATYLPANYLLPRWIARFKQHHDAVDFSVLTTNAAGAVERLERFDADIAFYGGSPISSAALEIEQLFEDELWFVVHPSHPLAEATVKLSEVMREPFIMREQGSSTRARLFALCESHRLNPPRIGLQFDGLNETVSAVAAGYGVNFVSSLVVRERVERGELARVRVRGVDLRNTIALCARRGDHVKPVVSAFVRAIKEGLELPIAA